MTHPDFAAGDVKDNVPIAVSAHMSCPNPKSRMLQNAVRRVHVARRDTWPSAVNGARKHVASAEHLDLVFMRPRMVPTRLPEHQFKGFVGIAWVEFIVRRKSSAFGEHEMAYRA